MANFADKMTVLSMCVVFLCLCTCATQATAKQASIPESDQVASRKTTPQQLCEKLCSAPHPCPPECYDLLDPWAMDVNGMDVGKRSSGIDGFTFDDYLFLRWLGRDLARHRLQK